MVDIITYNLNDAAKACGLGRTTLYEAIGRGELIAVKAGGRTLIPAESLRAFIAGLPHAEINAGRKAAAA